MNTTIIKEFRLSRKKSNAVQREYDDYRPTKGHQRSYQKQEDSKTINFNQSNPQRQRKPVTLIPKTVNQENYILSLVDSNVDVVIAGGPAGTGKTYLATLAAIQAYRNKEVSRIVICRPAVSIEGEEHGFLPGDLAAKLAPCCSLAIPAPSSMAAAWLIMLTTFTAAAWTLTAVAFASADA